MSKEKYDIEFQQEAVRLIITSGKTQREIASDLGITEWLLSIWKKKHLKDLKGNSSLSVAAEDKIKALEKELATVKQERDILKKAMGITLNI